MLEIANITKYAEIDDFDQGCLSEGSYINTFDYPVSGDLETIKEAMRSFGEIEINACEEHGRIDAFRMENDEGNEPSESELESWRQGKTRLWYVTYTAQVEEVTRNKAML